MQVLRPEHALAHLQRLTVDPRGLRELPLVLANDDKVVSLRQRVRVLRPEHAFPHLQRRAVNPVGLREAEDASSWTTTHP